jgi:hypothetical protein
MNRKTIQRIQATVMVTIAAILYYGAMLWSTCAGLQCGSYNSSIWPRIGLIAIPLVAVVSGAWHARGGKGIGGLAVSLPILAVMTVMSAWEVVSSPGSDPNAGFTAPTAEHSATVVAMVVMAVLIAVPLVLLGALAGVETLRRVTTAMVREPRQRLAAAATLVMATVLAVGLCTTSAAGATGIDVAPPSPDAAGLGAPPAAQTPPAPGDGAYVVLRRCPDQRLLNCTIVDTGVVPGASYDLAPGIYTLDSEPPAGITCSTSPATLYLFPFERIQVQFLAANCSSAAS